MKQYDVMVLGSYFCDIIFTGIDGFPALGTEIFSDSLNVTLGGVINTVIAFHRLGVHVGWVGALGNDFFSHFVIDALHDIGVPLDLVTILSQPLRFVTVSLSYPHDRAFITYTDKSPDEIDMLAHALQQATCRHLHFASLKIDSRIPDIIRQAKARGARVSMDCQHHYYTLDDVLVCSVLSELDIFMPNADEARQLTGMDTVIQAGECLARLLPTVIIKDGERGAHVWHDGQHLQVNGVHVEAVDTTGAGDVFNAGFLSAQLEGLPLDHCLQRGNLSAALSIRGIGGAANAPTLADIAQFARELSD